MEIPVFDQDVLYYVSAATGPGSVEAPFDRGILKDLVIHFQRSGSRVLVNQINLAYRAPSGTAARAAASSTARCRASAISTSALPTMRS